MYVTKMFHGPHKSDFIRRLRPFIPALRGVLSLCHCVRVWEWGKERGDGCVCVCGGGGGGYSFNVALRPQKPYILVGTGNPWRQPFFFSHSSWALKEEAFQCWFTSIEIVRLKTGFGLINRDLEPRTFTQLLSKRRMCEREPECWWPASLSGDTQ